MRYIPFLLSRASFFACLSRHIDRNCEGLND
ncbi:hypothetical protein [Oscillatoria sp. HE19RPO]